MEAREIDAKQILQMFFRSKVDFINIFSKPNHDLLRPLGEYVGVTTTPDDV
jgi:hypothetical protein